MPVLNLSIIFDSWYGRFRGPFIWFLIILDQDCVSEVNYCDNSSRLKDYVRVLLIELKSSHQIR
jgi:hypothetical protein